MIVRCQDCNKEYQDVYYSTSCPHDGIRMHCAVTINGVAGCAHTIEQLNAATAPNTDCEFHKFRELAYAYLNS